MYNVMYKEHRMTRMVRKQIYVRPEQDEVLKQKAEGLGISEAELIREYIDEGTQRPTASEREKANGPLVTTADRVLLRCRE